MLLATVGLGQAQETVIDSLENVIETATHDSIKSKALIRLSETYYISDPKLFFDLSEESLKICERNLKTKLSSQEQTFFEKYKSTSKFYQGMYYLDIRNLEEAESVFLECIEVAHKYNNTSRLSSAYGNLGTIKTYQFDKKEAIKYYLMAYDIMKVKPISLGQGYTLMNLGDAYFKDNNIEDALTYYFMAIEILKELEDNRGLYTTYFDIALIYSNLGDHEKEKENLDIAFEYAKEGNTYVGMTRILSGYANFYLENNTIDSAIFYHNKSLSLIRENNNSTRGGVNMVALAEIYLSLGEVDSALKYIDLAFEIGERTGNKKVLSMVHLINGVYLTDINRLDKALTNAQKG